MCSPEGLDSHNADPGGSLGRDMSKPHRDRSPSDPLAVGLTLYNVAAAPSLGPDVECVDSVPPGNAKTGRPRRPETETGESRARVRMLRGATTRDP